MIIGLCGRAGSGKDTLARLVCESGVDRGGAFGCVSFAQPLKEICEKVFAFSPEQLWGSSEMRNVGDPRYVRPDGSLLSPREALQTLGTEWGRRCYPNIWVELGIRRAREWAEERGLDHVFITDCRFENEVDAVRHAGGSIIRIQRPGQSIDQSHPSEREMGTLPDSAFDAVIVNDSTLENFERKAMQTVLELVRRGQSAAW